MTKAQFLEIIAELKERRNVEFKQSTPWGSPEWRAKIAKSVLALSNVRDGGWVIIGIRRKKDGSHQLEGMEAAHLATYVEDTLNSTVAEYADPYARLSLDKVNVDGKDYVVIRVEESDEIPVICKKAFPKELRKGAIYTRSYRIPETVEVPTQSEMREILERATDKAAGKFIQRMARAGIVKFTVVAPRDEDQFERQLRDLR